MNLVNANNDIVVGPNNGPLDGLRFFAVSLTCAIIHHFVSFNLRKSHLQGFSLVLSGSPDLLSFGTDTSII